jgi:hypothetical protein
MIGGVQFNDLPRRTGSLGNYSASMKMAQASQSGFGQPWAVAEKGPREMGPVDWWWIQAPMSGIEVNEYFPSLRVNISFR